MKFIKNGIIYEPHNEFVLEQMKKGGYIPYTEDEKLEETKEEVKEVKEQDTKEKKKTKKK